MDSEGSVEGSGGSSSTGKSSVDGLSFRLEYQPCTEYGEM